MGNNRTGKATGYWRSAAFTGHRNLPYQKMADVKAALCDIIRTWYGQGITNYYCGMAMGFDMLAAETVLRMKSELPGITLSAVIPYRNQSERFSPAARQRYNEILAHADKVTILYEEYHARCFLDRNDYMLMHSSRLVACYNGTPKGGTFYTYNKARRKGIPVTNVYGCISGG